MSERQRIAVAALAFMALTLLGLYVWRDVGGRPFYAQILRFTGGMTLPLLGLEDVRIAGGRVRYLNMIPFVALMLVTPGIAWKQRAIGLVGGLLILHVGHLLLNVSAHLIPDLTPGNPPRGVSIVSDALPFALWAYYARDALAIHASVRLGPKRR